MIMVQVVRPLLLRPNGHLRRCSFSSIHSSLNSASLFSIGNFELRELLTGTNCPVHRNLHSRSRGLRLPDAPPSVADFTENDSGSDSDGKKSRNEKKREARRSVRWGMELAAFSESQIKRILRVISAEPEVLDALMLVKTVASSRTRTDGWSNPRKKDGDQQKFEELSPGMWDVRDDDDEDEDTDYEDEEEELRRLVHKFCTMQGNHDASAENEGQVDAAVLNAKRSRARFLLVLAKQLPAE